MDLCIYILGGILLLWLHLDSSSSQIPALGYDCGYYQKVQPGENGSLTSPSHPSTYPDYTHCIWLLKAPRDYSIELTVTAGVQGELDPYTESCLDYLEIRNGSSTSPLLYKECNTTATETVSSVGRWLWVRFKTDSTNNNTGFYASWTVVSSPGNANDSTSPVTKCSGVNIQCANKECVYGAYRCDGYNDCGCTGSGCDEHSCQGLQGWSSSNRILVGVGVGTGVFLLIFVGIGVLELGLKKREKMKEKQLVEEQKRKLKQKKAKAREAKEAGEGLAVPEATAPSRSASSIVSNSAKSAT